MRRPQSVSRCRFQPDVRATASLLELAIRTMLLWRGASTLLFVPRRTTGSLHGLFSLELQNSGRKLMQPITLASASRPWHGPVERTAMGITSAKAAQSGPVYSPDGKRYAFVAIPHGEPSGIYIADADGTNLFRVRGGAGLWQPAWK